MSASEAEILGRIRGLIVDMDGVIHVGPEPVEGLGTFLDFVERRAIPVAYVTNNSTKSLESLCEKLRSFGIDSDCSRILDSASATAAYLADTLPEGGDVLVVGEEGLRRAVEQAGFKVDGERPRAVAVGMDRHIDYQKIQRAASAILGGAKFVACNRDSGAPKPEGIVPGAGSMVAAIEAVAQVSPVVIGKPEPFLFLQAAERLGLSPEDCAAVGDRLDVDIACAHRAGMTGILVLSGMGQREMISASEHQPDLVYEHIGELVARWKNVQGG